MTKKHSHVEILRMGGRLEELEGKVSHMNNAAMIAWQNRTHANTKFLSMAEDLASRIGHVPQGQLNLATQLEMVRGDVTKLEGQVMGSQLANVNLWKDHKSLAERLGEEHDRMERIREDMETALELSNKAVDEHRQQRGTNRLIWDRFMHLEEKFKEENAEIWDALGKLADILNENLPIKKFAGLTCKEHDELEQTKEPDEITKAVDLIFGEMQKTANKAAEEHVNQATQGHNNLCEMAKMPEPVLKAMDKEVLVDIIKYLAKAAAI